MPTLCHIWIDKIEVEENELLALWVIKLIIFNSISSTLLFFFLFSFLSVVT